MAEVLVHLTERAESLLMRNFWQQSIQGMTSAKYLATDSDIEEWLRPYASLGVKDSRRVNSDLSVKHLLL